LKGLQKVRKMLRLICVVLLFIQPVLVTATSASESAEHSHEFHQNTLFGFIGITGEDRRDRAGTVAIEYERRFSQRWGLSAGLEHAFGDLDFTVFTLPVVFHSGKWGLYAGPGMERHHGHDSEFLFRVGVVYEFEAGNVVIAPKFNVDFVDGDTVLVGGVAIGFGF
jgi:hypothetical protein